MLKFDKWVLEHVFEPAAQEIEGWTGADQFQVARLCLLIKLTADAASAIQEATPAGYATLGLSGLACILLLWMIRVAERLSGRRGVANSFKHDTITSIIRVLNYALAIFSCSLSALNLRISLATISTLALTAAWGFCSGDRLPPIERRVCPPVEAPILS